MTNLARMSDTLALDLFGTPVSGDPVQRKFHGTVSRLLRDIAACRDPMATIFVASRKWSPGLREPANALR